MVILTTSLITITLIRENQTELVQGVQRGTADILKGADNSVVSPLGDRNHTSSIWAFFTVDILTCHRGKESEVWINQKWLNSI